MFLKSIKIIALVLLVTSSGSLKADRFAVFPFCPQNTWLQSERLNNLHKIFTLAATTVKERKTEFLLQEKLTTNCEFKSFRTIAASLNSDQFLDASYLIKGDSVELSIRLVYTQFVDKFTTVAPVKGSLKQLNSCILGAFSSVFKELSLTPSETDWNTINNLVVTDAAKYGTVEVTTIVTNSDYYYTGKTAFEQDNYILAREQLMQVQIKDTNYAKAQYLLGKTHLYFNDFNKALFCFKNCESLGFTDPALDDYIQSCALLIKPAEWFNTPARRQAWWNSLDLKEHDQIVSLLNTLKINGKTYANNYVYNDNDIAKLFKITILPFKHAKVDNLLVYRYFTDVEEIIFENSKLMSDEGIQNFFNLQIIQSDTKIDKPQIAFLAGLKKITVIYTKGKK